MADGSTPTRILARFSGASGGGGQETARHRALACLPALPGLGLLTCRPLSRFDACSGRVRVAWAAGTDESLWGAGFAACLRLPRGFPRRPRGIPELGVERFCVFTEGWAVLGSARLSPLSLECDAIDAGVTQAGRRLIPAPCF